MVREGFDPDTVEALDMLADIRRPELESFVGVGDLAFKTYLVVVGG